MDIFDIPLGKSSFSRNRRFLFEASGGISEPSGGEDSLSKPV